MWVSFSLLPVLLLAILATYLSCSLSQVRRVSGADKYPDLTSLFAIATATSDGGMVCYPCELTRRLGRYTESCSSVLFSVTLTLCVALSITAGITLTLTLSLQVLRRAAVASGAGF